MAVSRRQARRPGLIPRAAPDGARGRPGTPPRHHPPNGSSSNRMSETSVAAQLAGMQIFCIFSFFPPCQLHTWYNTHIFFGRSVAFAAKGEPMASVLTVKRQSAKRRRATNARWRPATLAAFREADKLEADLAAGRTTKEQLIKEGRLFTSVKDLLADLNS